MASEKNLKAVIEPAQSLIWAGQALSFTFIVNKKPVPAKWSVQPPQVGKIDADTGRFEAEDELRYGLATVTGTATVDGKSLKATASIRFMMGVGLMHTTMYFADNFLKIPTISWNDPIGRRAAKLIIDAIHQLPKAFLEKVGTVALIRSNWADPPRSGVHLPLPGRVVVLTEYMFQKLRAKGSLPPEITAEDIDFVRNFIHEIAHVILANDGLNDFARWSVILASAASLAGGIYAGISLGGGAAALVAGWGAVPAVAAGSGVVAGIIIGTAVTVVADLGLLLLWYYANPFRQQDMAHRFGDKMGWSVRDPLFLSNLWGGGRVPPNVITGFQPIGWTVGLHNKFAPPEGASLKQWREAGFYDDYSNTDVHEHFAEVVAEIAMNSPKRQQLLAHPLFQEAKNFLAAEEILPADWTGIDVGKTALGFSKSAGKAANFEDFGVFLGLYAGALPEKKNKPAAQPAPKKSAAHTASAQPETFDDGASSGDSAAGREEPNELFAEGYGEVWDEDEAAETRELLQRLETVGRARQKFQAETAPVMDKVRQTIAELPFPIREDSLMELLRSAECHGIGLQRIGSADRSADAAPQPPVIENGVQTGDMLVDKRNNLWLVSRVEKQMATEIAGVPRLNENGEVEKGFDPADLIFYWRPTAEPRSWFDGQTAADAGAFAEIARLWGLETTPDEEYSLYRSGSFITVVLGALGKRVRDLAGKDDEEVLEYCAAHGRLLPRAGTEIKVRDIVRLSTASDPKWAFVLRSNPLDILVQGGGDEGEINEDENAAKILHDVAAERISHIWRWSEKNAARR